jgi:acyl-CoA synthetase (AMP-forming)/AMP-acid ligase II
MGPGVANECVETKDGLHIWEDHFYPEVINPATGEVLPDGEKGELVFTSLTKEAMPVIRYRTRDLTRLLPGTARSMRRMEKVTGRSDDMMIIRGVNVFPTQIEEKLLTIHDSPCTTSLCSPATAAWTICEIQVEARPDASFPAREAATKQLVQSVKDTIGITAAVTVLDPGSIERSVGKAKRIIDRRLRNSTDMARKRANDYDDKRQAILDRSAVLFSAHGYDRASMNKIAEACGVSKANLYHYYKDKEGCSLTSSASISRNCWMLSTLQTIPTHHRRRGCTI